MLLSPIPRDITYYEVVPLVELNCNAPLWLYNIYPPAPIQRVVPFIFHSISHFQCITELVRALLLLCCEVLNSPVLRIVSTAPSENAAQLLATVNLFSSFIDDYVWRYFVRCRYRCSPGSHLPPAHITSRFRRPTFHIAVVNISAATSRKSSCMVLIAH